MAKQRPSIRCAIYTRKSSEEGLEQDFNSLDAQYEACTAYVASQRHEGWKLISQRYDDGGISGGTLDRPALQRLLDDIDAGRVGMVMVYKIDRLTRSLADFVRLVEHLDAAGCSFVSVTQAFNTSTSMGRLTLNVLLSFAQFEREVTAERIRDKIAASKKKGMWMGGFVPMGYDHHSEPEKRGLVINSCEAKEVQAIFELYDQHSCLRTVCEKAANRGIRSKHRTLANGKARGGRIMSRGQIHYLLTNPIYVGRIRHKNQVWPGQHEPIINEELWERVQAKLQEASVRPRTGSKTHHQSDNLSQLKGIFRDETGDRLTPTYTVRRGKRLRYYVSSRLIRGASTDGSGWRLPALSFERSVNKLVTGHLTRLIGEQRLLERPDAVGGVRIAGKVQGLCEQFTNSNDPILRTLIASGSIAPGRIDIDLDRQTLASLLDTEPDVIAGEVLSIQSSFQLRRRGVEAKIIAGEIQASPDQILIQRLGDAHRWVAIRRKGMPLARLARKEGHSESYIRVRCQLAFLSPRIQKAILNGTQPPELSVDRIIRTGVPLDWTKQEHQFGFVSYS